MATAGPGLSVAPLHAGRPAAQMHGVAGSRGVRIAVPRCKAPGRKPTTVPAGPAAEISASCRCGPMARDESIIVRAGAGVRDTSWAWRADSRSAPGRIGTVGRARRGRQPDTPISAAAGSRPNRRVPAGCVEVVTVQHLRVADGFGELRPGLNRVDAKRVVAQQPPGQPNQVLADRQQAQCHAGERESPRTRRPPSARTRIGAVMETADAAEYCCGSNSSPPRRPPTSGSCRITTGTPSGKQLRQAGACWERVRASTWRRSRCGKCPRCYRRGRYRSVIVPSNASAAMATVSDSVGCG